MKRSKRASKAQTIQRLAKGFLDVHRESLRDQKEVHNQFRGSAWFELLSDAEIEMTWAHFYELPMGAHVLLVYLALGIEHLLRPAGSVEELAERLLINAETDDAFLFEHLEEATLEHRVLIISLVTSLMFSLESIKVYSVSLNEFVERVRNGSDLAFRRAVTIDPTVAMAPTMSQRLAFAVLEDDGRFLRFYRDRLLNPNIKRLPYRELRLVDVMLRELGAFMTLSRAEIHDLVVNKLRVYGNKDSDTFKALFSLLDSWKKDATK